MRRKVVDWRDERSAQPRGADIGVQVLRALLEYGIMRGDLTVNVAKGIKQLYSVGGRAEIVWTPLDLDAFERAAIRLGKLTAWDAVQLAALTGLRREDLCTLSWDEIGEDVISKKAAKRSAGKRYQVTVPRVAELDQLLKELRKRYRVPDVNAVLVNSRGKPWSPDGLSHIVTEVRNEAGIFHVDEDGRKRAKHLHDLRGTYCTKLMASGTTDDAIADLMGWAPEQVRSIRRVYVDRGQNAVAIAGRLQQQV